MPDQPGGSSPDRPRDRPVVLVCGWAGAGNIGDELLTDWVVDRIERSGGEVRLVTRSPSDTMVRHPSVEPTGWGPGDVARALSGVDAVCLGPGGIIQDRSSLWSLPGHLCRPLLGRLRRLPVAGIGLGADPLRRRSSRFLLRRALGGAIGVVVRDEPSAQALRGAGIDAEVAADLVFDLDALATGDRPPPGDHVVVALGPSLGPGRLRPAAHRLDHRGLGGAASTLTAWADRLDVSVAVAAFRGPADIAFATRLVELIGHRARLVPDDPAAIRAEIAGAAAVVSARYHAAVLALVEGIPVLARSDEPKLHSLASAIGDESRIRMIPTLRSLVDVTPGERHQHGLAPGSVDPNREVIEELVAVAADGAA